MTKPRALIVDDEPYYQDWLIEYMEVRGYEVLTAMNVDEACQALGKELFKMVIVDLSIPAGAGMRAQLATSDPLTQQYPGMYVAQYARDHGQWDDQVIIYSVHMSEDISKRAGQLFCVYVPKGRPDAMKEAVMAALKRGERREARRAANRAMKKAAGPKRKAPATKGAGRKVSTTRTGVAPAVTKKKHWPRAKKIRRGVRLNRGTKRRR